MEVALVHEILHARWHFQEENQAREKILEYDDEHVHVQEEWTFL
jgi:hypothetical protein